MKRRSKIEVIPIASITALDPRERNRKNFKQIVESINSEKPRSPRAS